MAVTRLRAPPHPRPLTIRAKANAPQKRLRSTSATRARRSAQTLPPPASPPMRTKMTKTRTTRKRTKRRSPTRRYVFVLLSSLFVFKLVVFFFRISLTVRSTQVDESFEEIDPTAIRSRRTRGVKVDYTSAEALAKAGLKADDAEDDE